MRVTITQFASAPPIPSAVTNNVVATAGGQTGATFLTGVGNIVTAGAAGYGVVLNAGIGGGRQRVFARMGADLSVYPAAATAIEGYGTNVPVTVRDGGVAEFTYDGVNKWLVS